jgi:hypothetical protein
MTIRYFFYDLESIMKRALITALLVLATVFTGGVIFGWEYALFLGFVILLAVSLIAMVKK